jgi:hypothetical protein
MGGGGTNDSKILFVLLMFNLLFSTFYGFLPAELRGGVSETVITNYNVTSPLYNSTGETVSGTSIWSTTSFLLALFLVPYFVNAGPLGVCVGGFFTIIKVMIVWLVIRLFRSGGG